MKISILLILLINVSISHCQVIQDWVKVFESPGVYDFVETITVDDLGDIIVGGSIDFNNDIAVLKYSGSGNLLWTATYGASGSDEALRSLKVDHKGNIYVAGTTNVNGSMKDRFTLKYNSSGVLLWTQIYNDTADSDYLLASEIDTNGNVYITGNKNTIKYDSSGMLQWIAKDSIVANDIAISLSGNIYVTGTSSAGTNSDYVTIKYNNSGQKIWKERYDGPNHGIDYANSIALDLYENLFITGISQRGTDWDFATLKYNSSGVQQWSARYGGNHDDIAQKIVVDNYGNIYVSGIVNRGYPYNAYDYSTLKYHTSGALEWVATYNGTGNWADELTDMALDSAGNIYVTGYSVGSGTGEDYTTIKYNPSGNTQWVTRFNGPCNCNDEAEAIAIDGYGNVYIAGETAVPGTGNLNFTTVKYIQNLTGYIETSNEIPLSYTLYQNYPNPFNPVTNIGYSITENSFVRLKVYDVLGNEIATLVNEKQNAGNYNYQFSTVNYQLSSGIYFYKLEAGSFTETKRMILIK